MRVALLSDIHGNLTALEAILVDMRLYGPFDEVVVAGDLVWAGPSPVEVIDRLRAIGAVAVQGNTDAYFGSLDSLPAEQQGESFAAQLRWMKERLGPERVAYLKDLPFSYRVSPAAGHDLLVVHANPNDLYRAIEPQMLTGDLDVLLGPVSQCNWEALAFGHLHVPFMLQWRGHLLINVASAGLPRDGDQRAVYAILTWDGSSWQAEHHRVNYEIPLAVKQMRSFGPTKGKYFAEHLVRENCQAG